MMPKVLNIRDLPGRVIPENAVYCGRAVGRLRLKASKYRNPYGMEGREEIRNYVCDLFEAEILPNLDVSELRGKDLVCWCAPLRCHCDAILKKANQEAAP